MTETLEFPLSETGLHALADSSGIGEPVILLHGFPDVRTTFTQQLEALSRKGYMAIAPSLRGYESATVDPASNYALDALARDVISLMDALELENAHLLGHDWGSTIAQACVAMAPERFRTLTIVSVPFVPRFPHALFRSASQLRKSWYMFFFQLPRIPEWWILRDDAVFLEWLWRSWSPSWNVPTASLETVKAALSGDGVIGAALGYYRQNFLRPTKASRMLIECLERGISIPTLAITGENDGCIDARVFLDCMRAEDFHNDLHVEVMGGAGHFPHQELPEAFSAIILDFINKNND